MPGQKMCDAIRRYPIMIEYQYGPGDSETRGIGPNNANVS
jgi:hypothetical protein